MMKRESCLSHILRENRACGICGCSLKWLSRSLSSTCSLKLQQKFPLWQAEMTEEEEKKFRSKTGIKNE